MSYQSETEARMDANATREHMNQPHAWEVRTWENLGWWWELTTKGGASLTGSCPGKFLCMLGREPGTGEIFWGDGTHEDPNEAVKIAAREARRVLNKLAQVVDSTEFADTELGRTSYPGEVEVWEVRGYKGDAIVVARGEIRAVGLYVEALGQIDLAGESVRATLLPATRKVERNNGETAICADISKDGTGVWSAEAWT